MQITEYLLFSSLRIKHFLFTFFFSLNLSAQQVWDIENIYGEITASNVQQAFIDAIESRTNNPNDSIILQLPQGEFNLDHQITVPEMNSNGEGWIILQGTGVNTVLIDTEYDSNTGVTMKFKSPYRLALKNFKFVGKNITSSQGTIINKQNGFLDIELDDNYPTIEEMYEIETTKANKLRIFNDDNYDSPHFIESEINDHYSNRWAFQGDYDHNGNPHNRPILLNGRIWRFFLSNGSSNPFEIGQRIGISSKSNRSNWGRFIGPGADVVVENVSFLRLGRVKFRNGWNNIRFTNCKIIRPYVDGKASFYSTDAGFQIGHEADINGEIDNVIVESCNFKGTVDDGIAFQQVKTGNVSNSYWEDGGGLLIGVSCDESFVVENNSFYHCPLEDNRLGQSHFKGVYAPIPMNNSLVNNQQIALQWSPGINNELYKVYFGTSNPPPLIANTEDTVFSTENLLPNTTYYWKVDAVNTSSFLGENLGDIWKFTTAEVLNIDKSVLEEKIIILHPNPLFSKKFKVLLRKTSISTKIEVFNILGQEILKKILSYEDEFDFELKEKGVYVIKVTLDDVVLSYKIIVQ